MQKQYVAIDLKSFYASVECIERELDPMTTNLVVADASRTEKTICLAVSPSLKAFGVPGRPRLFEVVQKVGEVNALRQSRAPGRTLTGKSWDALQLQADPALGVDYLIAPPRMAHYMEHSAKIYSIYLKYVAPEDIHVYSIDEVFMDVTPYLRNRGMTAREFTRMIIQDVVDTTGCGDSFFSGVCIGLTYGKSLGEAVEIGTMLAASVITSNENVCPRFQPEELGLEV